MSVKRKLICAYFWHHLVIDPNLKKVIQLQQNRMLFEELQYRGKTGFRSILHLEVLSI